MSPGTAYHASISFPQHLVAIVTVKVYLRLLFRLIASLILTATIFSSGSLAHYSKRVYVTTASTAQTHLIYQSLPITRTMPLLGLGLLATCTYVLTLCGVEMSRRSREWRQRNTGLAIRLRRDAQAEFMSSGFWGPYEYKLTMVFDGQKDDAEEWYEADFDILNGA